MINSVEEFKDGMERIRKSMKWGSREATWNEEDLINRPDKYYMPEADREWCAKVWFDGKTFFGEVHVWGSNKGIYEADSREALLDKIHKDWSTGGV